MESLFLTDRIKWQRRLYKRSMASHVVRAKIEKERRYIGAAFEIVRWSTPFAWSDAQFLMDIKGYNRDANPICILINGTSRGLVNVVVPQGEREAFCWFDSDTEQLRIREELLLSDCPECSVVLARGLYRLGFDNEEMWSRLNVTLTVHEKLELRLSMPREFWPKTWLDEENTGGGGGEALG